MWLIDTLRCVLYKIRISIAGYKYTHSKFFAVKFDDVSPYLEKNKPFVSYLSDEDHRAIFDM